MAKKCLAICSSPVPINLGSGGGFCHRLQVRTSEPWLTMEHEKKVNLMRSTYQCEMGRGCAMTRGLLMRLSEVTGNYTSVDCIVPNAGA